MVSLTGYATNKEIASSSTKSSTEKIPIYIMGDSALISLLSLYPSLAKEIPPAYKSFLPLIENFLPLIENSLPVEKAAADVEDFLNREGGIKGIQVDFILQEIPEEVVKGIDFTELMSLFGAEGMEGMGQKIREEIVLPYYDEISKKDPQPLLIFNFDFISDSTIALRQRLDQDEIVCFTTDARTKTLYPPGYVFSIMPTYEDQFALFIDWLSQDGVENSKEKPRLAILAPDIPLCTAPITPQTLSYCQEKGVSIVAQEVIPLNMAAMDITPQLKRIKAKRANWIYVDHWGQLCPWCRGLFETLALREGSI
jgi:hypothetical protein